MTEKALPHPLDYLVRERGWELQTEHDEGGSQTMTLTKGDISFRRQTGRDGTAKSVQISGQWYSLSDVAMALQGSIVADDLEFAAVDRSFDALSRSSGLKSFLKDIDQVRSSREKMKEARMARMYEKANLTPLSSSSLITKFANSLLKRKQ